MRIPKSVIMSGKCDDDGVVFDFNSNTTNNNSTTKEEERKKKATSQRGDEKNPPTFELSRRLESLEEKYLRISRRFGSGSLEEVDNEDDESNDNMKKIMPNSLFLEVKTIRSKKEKNHNAEVSLDDSDSDNSNVFFENLNEMDKDCFKEGGGGGKENEVKSQSKKKNPSSLEENAKDKSSTIFEQLGNVPKAVDSTDNTDGESGEKIFASNSSDDTSYHSFEQAVIDGNQFEKDQRRKIRRKKFTDRKKNWSMLGVVIIFITFLALIIAFLFIQLKENIFSVLSQGNTINEFIEEDMAKIRTDLTSFQEQALSLIVSRFPQSEAALLYNESSPQHLAFQWIFDQFSSDRTIFTTVTQLLQQYCIVTLLFSGTNFNRTIDGHLDNYNSTYDLSVWHQGYHNECNWVGVKCGEIETELYQKVISLDFSQSNFHGTLPPELGILSNSLSTLILSKNNLSGFIPTELAYLTCLEYLDLAENHFIGNVPIRDGMQGNVERLMYLNLSFNQFNSTIPAGIGSLSLLRSLYLRSNDLVGPIPSQIGLLPNLRDVDFRGNHLTQALPTEIGLLSGALESLQLQDNQLVGRLPSEVGLLQSLQQFNISNNNMYRAIPVSITQLGSLESLDVSNNIFTGTFPFDEWWKSNANSLLTSLRINQNSFEGEISFNAIIHWESLIELDLSFNSFDSITDPSIFRLSKNLRKIDLSGNRIVGSIPKIIFSATALQKLDLLGNAFTGTIPTEVGDLVALTSLSLSDTILEGEIPSEIGTLRSLRSLSLTRNEFLLSSIPSEIGMLSLLTKLDMSHNNLFGKIPSQIISLAPNLQRVDLSGNDLQGSVPKELWELTSLESLILSNPVHIGSSSLGLREIPSEVAQLTKLTTISLLNLKIEGSIPSSIKALSVLENLFLSSASLTGTFPAELCSVTTLKHLYISGTTMSGTIPSDIGNLSSLTNLQLSGFRLYTMPMRRDMYLHSIGFDGAIPSEVGKLTNLGFLAMGDNILSGAVPSELGQLTHLTSLRLSNNKLTKSIPTNIGQTMALTVLDISANSITGSIPSEIGFLTNLESLYLNDNSLTSTIPIQMTRELKNLSKINLNNNQLSGAFPSEIAFIAPLQVFMISKTSITGYIPNEICDYILSTAMVSVDCAQVTCRCCHCPTSTPSRLPTTSNYPSMSPTVSPSTSLPSESPSISPPSESPSSVPSTAFPTYSLVPTISLKPTVYGTCQKFSSISSDGTELSITNLDDGVETVELPFNFTWRYDEDFSNITISTNGVIFLGDTADTSVILGVTPIEISNSSQVPWISVAKEDLNPTTAGSIYTKEERDGNSFIVSWENIPHWIGNATNGLYFQAALFIDGRIEFRWGDGNPPKGSQIASGLRDDRGSGIAIPTTRYPFEDKGVTTSGTWPSNMCRTFVPPSWRNGSYKEFFEKAW